MRTEKYLFALVIVVQLMAPKTLAAQSVLDGLVGDGFGWVLVAAVLIGCVAVGTIVWRRHRAAEFAREIMAPPLIFPAAPASAVRSRPQRPAPPFVPYASGPPPFPVQNPAAEREPFSAPARPWGAGGGGGVEAAPAAAPAPAIVSAGAGAAKGALFEGQTIRFHIPADGTLQLLPGRLELVAGPDSGQVIRFVKLAGEPEITFGRSEGPPYRHVQLRIPTVSRQHAQMRLGTSGWSISNLSQTNPLVVNGEELPPGSEVRRLKEGDRIEMGELVFLFRER
jgi:pSer/pThr/pTyr-binding forkhead associated (FHA) protein